LSKVRSSLPSSPISMPVHVQTQIKETGPPYWLSPEPLADDMAELRGQKAGAPPEDRDEVSSLHPISLPLVHLLLSSDLLKEILPTTVGDPFLSLEKTVLLFPEFSSHCLQEVALLLTRGHTSPLSARLEQEVRECLEDLGCIDTLTCIDVEDLRSTGQITTAGREEVKLETLTTKVEMVEMEVIELETLGNIEAEDTSEPINAHSMLEVEKDVQEPEIDMDKLRKAQVILTDVMKKDRSFAGLDSTAVNSELARSAGQNSSKRRADQTSLAPLVKRTHRSPRPTAAAASVVERMEKESRSCEECFKQFKSQIGLTSHRQAKHEGILFPCTLCPAQYTRKSSLAKHRKSRH